jgi:hypothetical protein
MDQFITKQLLTSVGITVKPEYEEALLDNLNATLQERVGLEITDSLDEAQLETLVSLQENGDSQAVQDWLTANVPELGDIVKDEIDILLGEIAENADGLNETA